VNPALLLIPVFLPIAGGALTPVFRFDKTARTIYISAVTLMTSAIMWFLILNRPSDAFAFVKFTDNLQISFHIDGLSVVYSALIATLWPFAAFYSFEYISETKRSTSFFAFYTMTYGITLGIALAENLLTLYFFYEMLTLVTLPLVIYNLSKQANRAGRKYLYYSLGGASVAFIGLVFIILYGTTNDFVLGGVLDPEEIGNKTNLLLAVYVASFCGFGVKAAVFPFHGWLPDASVAPTPVTALLHAVAVVKSGVFAIMRITYYSFGTAFLYGTWAQHTVLCIAIFTVVFGSSMAVKQPHLKRRLAYSTVANLSYILIGVLLMTPSGLAAGLLHMVFHSVMKISAFFCIGAIMVRSGKNYVYEINGLGKKMPIICACIGVSALALSGIPPFAGFMSKWYLALAALEPGNPFSIAAVAALLISALLTMMYMFPIFMRTMFPRSDNNHDSLEGIRDPGLCMKLPIVLFSVAMLILGFFSQQIYTLFSRIATGLF